MPGDPFDRMNAAQPAQQVRPDLDQLADGIMNSPEAMKLFQHIFGTLNQPMPQPPTAPAQQGLGLVQSVAGALNPQFAPLFLQQQNAQANAQFGVQQQAFQEAMAGRRNALNAGTALVTSGIRANAPSRMPRGQIRVVKGPDGSPVLQEFMPTPDGGFIAGDILASGPDVLRFLPTPEGYVPTSPRTGEVKGDYVQKPGGGGPALPVPPAGIVSDVAASTATIHGLDILRSAYKDIRQKVQGQSLPGQVARSFVGGTRYGGAFDQTRDYAEYTSARRAALNAYIKSVTGAQFSVAELNRYEAMFPEPWDDETLAEQKLNALSQRAVADMKAKIRAFPAAAPAAPPQDLDTEFEEWKKKRGG